MILNPAQSLIKNQDILSKNIKHTKELIDAVGRTGDLMPSQWVQIMAFALEFKPDLILELGRGYGNSTCAFVEVCHLLNPLQCEVISLCLSKDWDTRTVPKIRKIVKDEWFIPVKTFTTNLFNFDYEEALVNKKRVIIFWDAHGFDIAEFVLGHILPLIKDKEHIVIMHDISDARYISEESRMYGENGIWKGKNTWDGARVNIANINSCVEQSIAALDFCTRNKIQFHSPDESFYNDVTDDQWNKLTDLLGEEFTSKNGHWFWFSMNESEVELTFPKISVVKTKKSITQPSIKPEQYSEMSFDIPLYQQFGEGILNTMDKVFYGENKLNALVTNNNVIAFNPTTIKDHLATHLLNTVSSIFGGDRLIKITLMWNAEILQNCKIYIQDQDYQIISHDILDPENVQRKRNGLELVDYLLLGDNTSKIRVIISSSDGGATILPRGIRIEQALQKKKMRDIISNVLGG